jgi:hypothetical protein
VVLMSFTLSSYEAKESHAVPCNYIVFFFLKRGKRLAIFID